MDEGVVNLLVTRIHRGIVEVMLQPNTIDLWRLPQVDVSDWTSGVQAAMAWFAAATPFTQMARLAKIKDSLAANRVMHLVHVHDAGDDPLNYGLAWYNVQTLPPLAFLNEKRLFEQRTREITELIIAHQNPYKLIPGFR
jgi:hypothetical protein